MSNRLAVVAVAMTLLWPKLVYCQEATEQSIDSPTPRQRALALYGEARVSFRESNLGDALRKLDEARELHDSPTILLARAMVLDRMQRPKRAIEAYRAYMRRRPTSVDTKWVVRRISYLSKGAPPSMPGESDPGKGVIAPAPSVEPAQPPEPEFPEPAQPPEPELPEPEQAKTAWRGESLQLGSSGNPRSVSAKDTWARLVALIEKSPNVSKGRKLSALDNFIGSTTDDDLRGRARDMRYDLQFDEPVATTASGRRHDGFYFRVGVGAGYGAGTTTEEVHSEAQFGEATNEDLDVDYTGWGPEFEILIGGSPVAGFVLGGALLNRRSSDVNVSRGDRTTAVAERRMSEFIVTSLGPFFDWYPNASGGFHVGVMTGVSLVSRGFDGVGAAPETAGDEATAAPFAATTTGWDVWVAEQWSLGPEMRILGTKASGTSMVGVDFNLTLLLH